MLVEGGNRRVVIGGQPVWHTAEIDAEHASPANVDPVPALQAAAVDSIRRIRALRPEIIRLSHCDPAQPPAEPNQAHPRPADEITPPVIPGISRRSILGGVTDDELFEAISDHRSRLVDQLEPLTDRQWHAQSLCQGWEVRHVVGHLVSVLTVPTWRFIVGSAGMAGFHRKVDRYARQYAERDKADLLAQYRELTASRRAPARIGPVAPLMDVLVHSLDIGKPLGLPPILDAPATRAVLTAMSDGFPVMAPKARSKGLRLETNDLDWATGSGPLVRGSAANLALALSGRPSALDDLEGDGIEILKARVKR